MSALLKPPGNECEWACITHDNEGTTVMWTMYRDDAVAHAEDLIRQAANAGETLYVYVVHLDRRGIVESGTVKS